MDGIKAGTVTGGTVAAHSKGLADGKADQVAVCVMAAGTTIMDLGIVGIDGIGIHQRRRIGMTAGTTAGPHLDNGAMIHRSRMDSAKDRTVTGLTIVGRRIANGTADKRPIGVMAAGACVMDRRIGRISQRCRAQMTVITAG